jgi:hypothetical protein
MDPHRLFRLGTICMTLHHYKDDVPAPPTEHERRRCLPTHCPWRS